MWMAEIKRAKEWRRRKMRIKTYRQAPLISIERKIPGNNKKYEKGMNLFLEKAKKHKRKSELY